MTNPRNSSTKSVADVRSRTVRPGIALRATIVAMEAPLREGLQLLEAIKELTDSAQEIDRVRFLAGEAANRLLKIKELWEAAFETGKIIKGGSR